MKLSVVIPCFNAAATLPAQLTALSAQQWDGNWEVIVADNGSDDESRNIVAKYHGRVPGLRVVDASARRGAAHARNRGVRESEGDLIAFCDADDQVGAGWVAAIAVALARDCFVASRMDYAKLNGHLVGRGLSRSQEQGLQRISYPPYWLHSGGSGLGVRRAVHEQVGGFDESLPFLEDTDYCFRVQRAGYPLVFVATACIHVRIRHDSRALFNQARHWAQYNVLMNRRYGRGDAIPHPWKCHVQGWRNLLGCLPRVFNRERRPAWLKSLGTQIGLLEGAIRYRVPPVR
jgi:glycosyltransferase involved in cell wall biosynthesis